MPHRGGDQEGRLIDSKVEKWRQWLEDHIRPEVYDMQLKRATFLEVFEIAQEAELPESYFWNYLRETYATTQAVAIRRQAEISVRVVTLGSLISELRDSPDRVTRKFFTAMWDADDQHQANHVFNDFARDAGDRFDPSVASADLAELTETAADVKAYVDEHLAHSDLRKGEVVATFKGIDSAIDLIGRLYARYVLLLTAVGYVTLVPQLQHNWRAIFTRAWLQEPGRPATRTSSTPSS